MFVSSQDPRPAQVTPRRQRERRVNDDRDTLIMVPSSSCDSGECVKWDTIAARLTRTPYFLLMRV